MRRAFTVVFLLGANALAGALGAEQPAWDETARRLLVVRDHNLLWHQEYLGLWSFDPDTQAWEKLRHFSYSGDPYGGSEGRGCTLSPAEGVVEVQAWPVNLELEAGSYRLIGRTSSLADPAAQGWSVQGPVVGRRYATALGLSPGAYGIALCGLPFVDPFVYTCPPYQLPGHDVEVQCTDSAPWPLLYRDEVGGLDLAALMPPLDWDTYWPDFTPVFPTLSLDPGRSAFWRGTPRGVQLLPIEGGSVGQPVETHSFEFPPFDDPEFMIKALFYHPLRHQVFLFGLPFSSPSYDSFMALDESLQPVATFDRLPNGDPVRLGRPVTFTALGEQPGVLEQLLPVVAHTPGRNGTFWTSDLWLYNPSSQPTSVELRRVAVPAAKRTVQLGPHGSTKIADALVFLGGGPEGDGTTHDAVVLTSPYRWGEQVVAASRSFTPSPDGGTFGHAVTAAPSRAGYSNHMVWQGEPEPEWMLSGLLMVPYAGASTLYADHRVPGQFRHNLGVVNDSDQAVTLTLVWGHMQKGQHEYPISMGQRPASAIQTVEVAPHSTRIVQLETLFPPEVTEVWPPRIGVWGSRPVALWFSMVDNLTGDATFVPYSSMSWGTDLYMGNLSDVRTAVPVVVHAAGEAGTEWRTDVYGTDWLLQGYTPWAWLHPQDPAHDCSGAGQEDGIRDALHPEVAQPPEAWPNTWGNWGTVIRDVARAFPPCAAEENLHAGLELLSATWLFGWTRTYTTREDGGTYGEMLPFYPLGGWPVQHFAGIEVGSQFRVNVGLFNGDHDHAITHRVTLYAADGTLAAERILTLQPLASYQRRLEHLFGMEVGALPAGTYGLAVLPLDDPEHGVKGRSWAYVSLVDNVTGDPTNWW